uniref:EF-hand domain-containing protein n=1 Tax=Salix viminalis TaxID=40686 RepID=A0A6N2MTM2_SALVM
MYPSLFFRSVLFFRTHFFVFAYFGLKGSLGERLFDLVTQQRKDNKLTFHDLVIAKSVYEKGTRDDIEEFIYQLIDVTGDGVVGR